MAISYMKRSNNVPVAAGTLGLQCVHQKAELGNICLFAVIREGGEGLLSVMFALFSPVQFWVVSPGE